MNARTTSLVVAVVFGIGLVMSVEPQARAQQKPVIQIPDPGVPEAMTIQGTFVRGVWNNEAYAILGYRLANTSVGEEWMLLEFGTTVLDKTPDTRSSVSTCRSTRRTARHCRCPPWRNIGRPRRRG